MLYESSIGKLDLNKYDEVWLIVRSLKNKSILNNKNVKWVPELAPSSHLFNWYLNTRKKQKWNINKFNDEYTSVFLNELYTNEESRKALNLLYEKCLTKNICIVCFCKDYNLCHRKIVYNLICGVNKNLASHYIDESYINKYNEIKNDRGGCINNKIGVTERGDGGLDFSWVDKIKDLKACIVISKNINDKLIKYLLENKSKIILHATITGYGGSILEPNVPYAEWNFSQLNKLIAQGFPKEQIVLRLDPVIPTPKGLQVAQRVLDINASSIKISRVRTSMIDMYSHVWERFKKVGLYHPYNGNFYPNEKQKHMYCNLLKKYSNINTFEICNESINIGERIGCVSKKDINILKADIQIDGCANQRKGCLCPSNKMELLDNKKQCKHGCLYCYWKTSN